MMEIKWTQSMNSNKSAASAKLDAQWNIYKATGGSDSANQHIVQM